MFARIGRSILEELLAKEEIFNLVELGIFRANFSLCLVDLLLLILKLFKLDFFGINAEGIRTSTKMAL